MKTNSHAGLIARLAEVLQVTTDEAETAFHTALQQLSADARVESYLTLFAVRRATDEIRKRQRTDREKRE